MQNVINLAYYNETFFKKLLQYLVARKAQNTVYDCIWKGLVVSWLSLFLFLEMSTIGPIRARPSHLPSIRNQSLFFSPQLHTEKWKVERSTPILIQNTCSCTTSQEPLSLLSIRKQMWNQFPWKWEHLKILQFLLNWNSLYPMNTTSHLFRRVRWITTM